MRTLAVALTALLAAAPACAQEHDHGHGGQPIPAPDSAPMMVEHDPMDHGAMGHENRAASGPDATPSVSVPASGPATAADAIWGADAMRPARENLYQSHGGMPVFWLQGDRAELRLRQGQDGYLWDLQGYYGGDRDKFWFKSEGEGAFGEPIEQAEIQALYSRAIAPFFDLQVGVRQDLDAGGRTHAVVGVQGLAPYLFEIDAAAFLSDQGDLTARIEAEYDQRVTQRLILQPRAEANLSAQDMAKRGIGRGVDAIELGLRLRYEVTREFAPYIGVEQEWKLGGSRRYARTAGADPSVTNYVVGLRFWF